LRRFAIAPDAPKNTASRMLKIMTILIKKQMPQIIKLISYQDIEVHKGTIYKASNWVSVTKSGNPQWKKSRKRRFPKRFEELYKKKGKLYAAPGPKIRWEKNLY